MAINPSPSILDANQIVQRQFDGVNDAARVNIVSGTITASNPSVGTNGAPAPTSSTEISGINPGGNLTPVSVDNAGNQNVNVVSSVLPTGAATGALQTALNAQIPATLGQKTMAASLAVAIASDQSAIPISGTVTANIGTTNGLALDISVNSLLKPASTLAAVTTLGSITSSVTIKADTAINQTNALKVDGSAVTQPVSAASLPLPTGASTSALQTALNAQIPATLGQKTSVASLAVVIASDQSPVAVSGTVTATNAANGATGAVVPAQATQVAGSDGTNLRALKVSTTGVLSIDGSATTQPISAVSLPLPTGAATSANQTTELATLATIQTNTNRLGALTDGSGTTSVTPSTSTQVFAANASRRYLFIENLDATNSIYINFTSVATAGAGSIKILPGGGSFVMESGFISTEIVNILSTVASVVFTAKQG